LLLRGVSQVAAEELVATAAKALKWDAELPIELISGDYSSDNCRDMSLLALQRACCIQVANNGKQSGTAFRM
jgi:hypothetical protein